MRKNRKLQLKSAALFSRLLANEEVGILTQIRDQSTHADDLKHKHFQEQPDAFEQSQPDLLPKVAV